MRIPFQKQPAAGRKTFFMQFNRLYVGFFTFTFAAAGFSRPCVSLNCYPVLICHLTHRKFPKSAQCDVMKGICSSRKFSEGSSWLTATLPHVKPPLHGTFQGQLATQRFNIWTLNHHYS